MARIHGKRGRIYLAVASGGTAEPIPFMSSWSINFETEKAEVTAFGDNNKVYVAGLPDASGEFGGFYDDATAQTYTAAVDGQPRKFYLYPSTTTTASYFFGEILPDFSVEGAVDDAVSVTSSWSASSEIKKVG